MVVVIECLSQLGLILSHIMLFSIVTHGPLWGQILWLMLIHERNVIHEVSIVIHYIRIVHFLLLQVWQVIKILIVICRIPQLQILSVHEIFDSFWFDIELSINLFLLELFLERSPEIRFRHWTCSLRPSFSFLCCHFHWGGILSRNMEVLRLKLFYQFEVFGFFDLRIEVDYSLQCCLWSQLLSSA